MELYSLVEYCSLYSCVMGFLSTVTNDLPEEDTFTKVARDIYIFMSGQGVDETNSGNLVESGDQNSYQLKCVESSVLTDLFKGRCVLIYLSTFAKL